MKGLSDTYVESVIRAFAKGRMTARQAAAKLGITRQYANRLRKAYAEEGPPCLRHGNSGRTSPLRTDPETEGRIVSLYKGKYEGFNFRHFAEKLREDEGIEMSYGAIYRMLRSAGIKSPKRHKARKEKAKHPSRPRREGFGELLQIDASIHRWLGEDAPKATLHGAIDDATGTVMGLYFDREETLRGYYEMAWAVLTKYGIPEAFYGDRRTIFEYRRLSERDKAIERDTHAQFRRMCEQLGIELITTSVSQAKGRIERLWGTLQSRLVSELRARGIKTIEEANAFLPEFTSDYNKRFASEPDMEKSLFAPSPAERDIDFYLSVQYRRVADNGSSIGFKGRRLQLVDGKGNVARIPPKAAIDVYVTRKGKEVAVFDGEVWGLREIEERPVEEPKPKPKGRPKYIPGPNHPWRQYAVKIKSGGNK